MLPCWIVSWCANLSHSEPIQWQKRTFTQGPLNSVKVFPETYEYSIKSGRLSSCTSIYVSDILSRCSSMIQSTATFNECRSPF